MSRPSQLLTALAVSVRSPSIRGAELAWGAAIAAEWAHFVALGVFAYEQGGAAAVGIAGLVRLLPAAVARPVRRLARRPLPRASASCSR